MPYSLPKAGFGHSNGAGGHGADPQPGTDGPLLTSQARRRLPDIHQLCRARRTARISARDLRLTGEKAETKFHLFEI